MPASWPNVLGLETRRFQVGVRCLYLARHPMSPPAISARLAPRASLADIGPRVAKTASRGRPPPALLVGHAAFT